MRTGAVEQRWLKDGAVRRRNEAVEERDWQVAIKSIRTVGG